MRILQTALLFGALIQWSASPTYAQTEGWADNSADRHGLEYAPEIDLFGPYSDGKGAGIVEYLIEKEEMRKWQHMNGGTHWYEEDCCSEKDCRSYPHSDIIYNRDSVLSVRYGMTWIEIPKNLIKLRPPKALHDDVWHVCI